MCLCVYVETLLVLALLYFASVNHRVPGIYAASWLKTRFVFVMFRITNNLNNFEITRKTVYNHVHQKGLLQLQSIQHTTDTTMHYIIIQYHDVIKSIHHSFVILLALCYPCYY